MSGIWADVVGQEAAVAVLRRAIEDPAAMTHAWLVTGPPGSGRSVAARAFAAELVADSVAETTGDPGAGEDAAARVLRGTHPDVTVVATDKTVITVAEVRELVTLAQRAPAESGWRVVVVEDADRIIERSANALLKAIEEPPPRTVWVLCAPSEQDVITTIRSRCRHVGLRVPPARAVAELLVRRHGVGEDRALTAALAAQSHIGLATRLALDEPARERRARALEIATSVRGVGDAVIAAGSLSRWRRHRPRRRRRSGTRPRRPSFCGHWAPTARRLSRPRYVRRSVSSRRTRRGVPGAPSSTVSIVR